MGGEVRRAEARWSRLGVPSFQVNLDLRHADSDSEWCAPPTSEDLAVREIQPVFLFFLQSHSAAQLRGRGGRQEGSQDHLPTYIEHASGSTAAPQTYIHAYTLRPESCESFSFCAVLGTRLGPLWLCGSGAPAERALSCTTRGGYCGCSGRRQRSPPSSIASPGRPHGKAPRPALVLLQESSPCLVLLL